MTTGNLGGHQYTARVEILPFGKFEGKGDYVASDLKREKSPKLAIGATYDWNDKAVKDKSNQGKYMLNDSEEGFFETNINTVFVDAMFKYNGISFMGEYANRDASNAIATDIDGTSRDRRRRGTLPFHSRAMRCGRWLRRAAARHSHGSRVH